MRSNKNKKLCSRIGIFRHCLAPVFVAVLALGILAPTVSYASSIVATAVKNAYDIEQNYNKLKSAYASLGVHLDVVFLPAARGLDRANAGDYDATLVRPVDIEHMYLNLRRVDVSVGTYTYSVAFRKEKSHLTSPSHFDDFKHLDAGYTRGIPVLKKNLAHSLAIEVTDGLALLRLLNSGRIDYGVAGFGQMENYITKFPNIQISNKPIAQIQLFHYVNKRLEALIKPLEHELRKQREIETQQSLLLLR